jgi:hypothetical protein
MTPKKKAEELVNKMYMCDDSEGNYPMCFDSSKQCALIAVEFAIEFAGGDMNEQFDKILYLIEVKEEIKQL